MDQPLFSCTKCFRNFPQSEMSRSGHTCRGCNPHHSTFKQCEYCKSDFKHYVDGDICPRCQTLKSKYGEPQPCSICMLKTAFGNALVCQRCLHYRNRFGEPLQCQSCGNMCAFLKDEISREKVDGRILCWVCTYDFKLARSREQSSHGTNKRRHDTILRSDSFRSKTLDSSKRTRSDEYTSRKNDPHQVNVQQVPSNQAHNLDSVYNEHLLTIGQLQDEVKALKRQLTQKEAEMISKDRVIAELRSEIIDMKNSHEDRVLQLKSAANLEQQRLTVTIRQLQKEKISLTQDLKRRKSNQLLNTSLKHSVSSVTLFNPDSPISVGSSDKTRVIKQSNRQSLVKTTLLQNIGTPDNSVAENDLIANVTDKDAIVNISKSIDHSSGQLIPNPHGVLHCSSDSEDDADEDSGSIPKPDEHENQQQQILQNPKPGVNANQNTSSPDLTPSMSSGPLSDDENSQSYQFNLQTMLNKDPLGLDTPSESDEET